jgi:hypothetical protein
MSQVNRYIGIGHYSRTGKDTLANAIVACLQSRGVSAKKVPFADSLKKVAKFLYGWAGLMGREYYDDPKHEHKRDIKLPHINLTPVDIWCLLGTDAIRNHVYNDTWVDYILRQPDAGKILVIPDVRFPNEADAIRDRGGLLVKVVRPGFGPRHTTADRALLDYCGWDLVIGGSGAITELFSRAQEIAEWACGGPKPEQNQWDREQHLSVEIMGDTQQQPA